MTAHELHLRCLKKECMRHADLVKWKGEGEQTNSHPNSVGASSIIFFLDLLLGQEGKKALSQNKLWKNIASSMTINSLPGIDRHYGPLTRPSSALWWFRSNLAVLYGQKNGPYGALPKLCHLCWGITKEHIQSAYMCTVLQNFCYNIYFVGVNKNCICIWGWKSTNTHYVWYTCCKLLVLWWH